MDIRIARSILDRVITKRDRALAQIKEEKEQLQQAETLIKDVQEAQKYVQQVAEHVQEKSHKQIAKVVSKCLSAVFKEPYELRIKLELRRGRTEVDFIYLRAGRKVYPRVTSGGVLDVAALALRMASLVVTLPAMRRFLALDEPWKGLSKTNLQKMAALIETLSVDLGIQFLIATHDSELMVGKVIELDG